MVRIEKNKLIIEIETNDPLSEIVDLQKAIIDTMSNYQTDGSDGMTNYSLGALLSELMPTWEQNKELYSIKD